MDSIMDFKPEAVVVGAGMFPDNPIPLHWLEERDVRVVCCDGAANSYIPKGMPLWRIVGDCDSLRPDYLRDYAPVIRRFRDQETNDQTKAVNYLLRHGVRRIAIIGATGLREDHTLGNISLLVDYRRKGIDARIYTDSGVFVPVESRIEFSCPKGTQVSVFNFGAKGFKSTGLRYPLYDFTSWWQGTLNHTTADRFTIEASGDFLLFVNY